jgi:hypothetical protein
LAKYTVLDPERSLIPEKHDLVVCRKPAVPVLCLERKSVFDHTAYHAFGMGHLVQRANVAAQMR